MINSSYQIFIIIFKNYHIIDFFEFQFIRLVFDLVYKDLIIKSLLTVCMFFNCLRYLVILN